MNGVPFVEISDTLVPGVIAEYDLCRHRMEFPLGVLTISIVSSPLNSRE